MSDRSIGSRIGAVFAHMRDNTLLWGSIFAVIALVSGTVRYLQAEPSYWGDAMAFAGMACGMMIIIGGERAGKAGPEFGTTSNS